MPLMAILTAMEQEGRLIAGLLEDPAESSGGGRRFVTGSIFGVPVVTSISG